MAAPDRLQELIAQDSVAGVDFVYVYEDQQTLDVYFFRHETVSQAADIVGSVGSDHVRIYSPTGGERLPEVPLDGTPTWEEVDERDVLRLSTAVPGDFALYRLQIDHPNVDLYFNDVAFSFKANCPSDLDCKREDALCPSEDRRDFPVDYRARDFWSYRRALLDFASLRYPGWKDRLAADVGVMLVEAMSALGDELAYYQDRIAREAYLETATQRRSLRRHARLVDYEPHNGLGVSTWIDVTVATGRSENVPAGADVWAISDKVGRISFEVGRGLADRSKNVSFPVAESRNALDPHIWDEDDTCAPVGATELFVKGVHSTNLSFDDPLEDPDGKWVLLKTEPENPADPARRWLVRIIETAEYFDHVFEEHVTRIRWEEEQALPFQLNMLDLTVRCNIVPATAGRTVLNRFVIGVDPSSMVLPAEEAANLRRSVGREGTNDSVTYLFSLVRPELMDEDKGEQEAEAFLLGLEKPEGKNLTWLGESPHAARPEIELSEVQFDGAAWVEVVREPGWQWRRSLLGVSSSFPLEPHYTLEDGTWDRVVGYWRSGRKIEHVDYASSEGYTVRFGDGEFGTIPTEGTVFQATYRLGNGLRTNVPADSITNFDPGLDFIESLNNPLAADCGTDPETTADVRRFAPQAFRSLTYRAVRAEDYAEAVERLAWVQRAGATFRWTGSWLTLFAIPDPLGAVTISEEQHRQQVDQLDRFRQAGREAYPMDPRYADLDLTIEICVEPFAFRGEVKEAVLAALTGKKGKDATPGFFSPDNFTFGTPLRRSTLEACIQSVPGVRAVWSVTIKRRDRMEVEDTSDFVYQVGMDEVVRVENDPLYPARGSIRLIMRGGA